MSMMKSRDELPWGCGCLTLLFSFTLWATGVVIPAWVVGSLVTSGIKAATDNCGQVYVVETIISGDWFCPEVKNEG